VVGVVIAGVSFHGAGIAQAASSKEEAGSPEAVPSAVSTVAVPGTTTVVTDAGVTSATSITLPGAASNDVHAAPGNVPSGTFQGQGQPVLSTTLPGAAISSYATGSGTQTLISISSATAAKEYRFPLSLPEESTAEVQADGSVLVRDSAGQIAGGYRTPWAYDANGEAVPTAFTLSDGALVQSVDFDHNTAFPVTADPNDFWGWTRCVATVTAEVAKNVLLAGDVAKLIQRVGSFQSVLETLLYAWNTASGWDNKWLAVVAAGEIVGEILGIKAIKEACFNS